MVRAALAILVGCGAHAQAPAPPAAGNDVMLYRDLALVRQRLELDVPASPTTAKLVVATGLAAEQILVVDRGGLAIGAVHVAGGGAPGPTELELDVSAPRAGRYAIVVAYLTDRIKWDAAYTMTATQARDRAVLRGAVAIRNSTGIALRGATVRVVDAELGAWRGRTAEHLASMLVGEPPSSTPATTPREVGRVDLGTGETRVELLAGTTPRTMRSVLVYDPIGTKLDNPSATPSRELELGNQPTSSTRITESFEVDRDEQASVGLPAGPVRLLERRDDGTLVVLGESRLFDAATRVADVDTIAIGTANGVTGRRERRELTIDDEGRRIVEEFVITVDNARPRPVSLLIREHLYRGQNWTLAYESAPGAAKEGPQQIALRTDVPANAQAKVLYVVVYTWDQ